MKIYEETQRSIEEMAGRINGRFSQVDWIPVRFSTRRIPYEEMVAWFCHADVCWITPLRDGLNLVAKEYAAARRHRGGVLVLSEFTGASVVLEGAVLTNPYSNRRMDEAIEAALAMPEDEQRQRMETMSAAVGLHRAGLGRRTAGGFSGSRHHQLMVFRRRLIALGLGVVLLMGVVWGRQQQVQSVTILMPAPYADATAALVDRFNDDHRGRIHLSISRGPLETESISDLAISSLLLGSPPFLSLIHI